MIHYPLEALASAGISEIAVIVGYQSEIVIEALKATHPNLSFIFNEHFDGENALSIYAARSFVGDDPFIVCMGDHPIAPELLSCLVSNHQEHNILCVDTKAWHPSQTNDATRVLVDSGKYILKLGKELKDWNATDTGVFQMTCDVFPAIEHLMGEQGDSVGISDVVRLLGDKGQPFATCDVSGNFWADVDTLEDYQSIDRFLSENHG